MRTSSTCSSVHTVYTQNRPHTVAEKDSFFQTDIVVTIPPHGSPHLYYNL